MKFSVRTAAVCFGMLAFCAPAKAIVFSGTVDYYSHAPGGDFGNELLCCGHYNNLAQGTLVNGRPAYNPSYVGQPVSQVNVDGTLAWWDGVPNGSGFSTTSSGQYIADIFTPNGTGDNNLSSFQTAIFSLSLLANTAYTLTYTGDDDVFIALGNQIISQDAGIHAAGQQNVVSFNTADSNDLRIFFADRLKFDSSLDFTIEAAAVPGPIAGAGIPGLVMALSGLVAWRRRRRQGAVA